MPSLSKLSQECAKCPFANKCKHKRMEHEAYIQPASAEIITPLVQPVMAKHDYRDVKVSPDMTVTIDLDDLVKQIKRDIYRKAGIGIDYGA